MADEIHLDPVIGGECSTRSLDAVAGRLAARQHGLVARRQLEALGATRRAIDHRVERGRLHVVHRGVYAVGHRLLSKHGRWMAAVLAEGPGAVLSHRSAAALWSIRGSSRARIEVIAPTSRRCRAGIQTHRHALRGDEITVHDGIPVTTPARTLLDLAAVLDPERLSRAVNQAEVLRLADSLSLDELLIRHPGRRGIRALEAIAQEGRLGAEITRSELEDRFLAFLRDFDLPRPEVNPTLILGAHALEVDCLWRAERLVVELDGRAAHATVQAFERDRLRDRLLTATGWRVVRITWSELHRHPRAVAADLERLLGPASSSRMRAGSAWGRMRVPAPG